MATLLDALAEVFISYSRSDVAVAERIRDLLNAKGFHAYLDLHDILPGEPWQDRIGRLIETADAVIFLLSPESVASTIVDWEVNEAERLGKRILPVVVHDAELSSIPGRIKRLNYVFMRNESEVTGALPDLVKAVLTNIDWVREHSRLGELAAHWRRSNEMDEVLLRGTALAAAEDWISEPPHEAPEATSLHRSFIRASRAREQRLVEREKARLAEVAGAQTRTARAQRRTFVVLTAMLIGTFIGLSLVYSFWQNVMTNRSEFLATLAEGRLVKGSDPVTAILLGLEALPDESSARLAQRAMPLEASARHVFDAAWRDFGARRWIERKQLAGHKDKILAVAISPKSNVVLTGSFDKTAKLWDAASGKLMATLAGHSDAIRAVTFSPDGQLAITASLDKTVGLWDAASGKKIAELTGHIGPVRSVSVSPNGLLIASGSDDHTARIWDATTGKHVRTLAGHTGWIAAVAFSPDGRTLLTGSLDQTARLWETHTGQLLATLSGNAGWITSVAFSSDGMRVATGSFDAKPKLWDAKTGKQIAVLAGHRNAVRTIAFSPDASLVATGSDDMTARIWDASTGKQIAVFGGHRDKVTTIAFSPDGTVLATASGHDIDVSKNSSIRFWDIETEALLEIMTGHQDAVLALAVSDDGRFIATGSRDNTARLWRAPTKSEAITMNFEDVSWAMAISPGGRLSATSSGSSGEDIKVKLWEVSSGETLANFTGHDGHIRALAFSPDGRLIASVANDKTARLWDTKTKKSTRVFIGHTDEVTSVSFSPDGLFLATGSNDRTVLIWEVATGKLVLRLVGHDEAVVAVAFTPDGREVISGSLAGTIRVWAGGKAKKVTKLSDPKDWNGTFAFSSTAKFVAVGLKTNVVRIYSVTDGAVKAELQGHSASINAIAFSRDDRLILTGSGEIIGGRDDFSARLWRVDSGQQLATLKGHDADVVDVAFAPGGERLFTSSKDGSVRLWPVFSNVQNVVDQAKSTMPRCLTPHQRRTFRLDPSPPRWCFERQLWPFHDPEATPPPSLTWIEYLVASWDWLLSSIAKYAEPTRSGS